jgi:hypothetical protein
MEAHGEAKVAGWLKVYTCCSGTNSEALAGVDRAWPAGWACKDVAAQLVLGVQGCSINSPRLWRTSSRVGGASSYFPRSSQLPVGQRLGLRAGADDLLVMPGRMDQRTRTFPLLKPLARGVPPGGSSGRHYIQPAGASGDRGGTQVGATLSRGPA